MSKFYNELEREKLVSIPKGAIMRYNFSAHTAHIYVSIPKGAIMRILKVYQKRSNHCFNSKRCDYELKF